MISKHTHRRELFGKAGGTTEVGAEKVEGTTGSRPDKAQELENRISLTWSPGLALH